MTLTCVKGNKRLGFTKGHRYPVVRATLQKRKEVDLVVRVGESKILVFARHLNRLTNPSGFNVHRGDPTCNARFAAVLDDDVAKGVVVPIT